MKKLIKETGFPSPAQGYEAKSVDFNTLLIPNPAATFIMEFAGTTIVEKGLAEDVISAATETGARGGTIINARGSGMHDTDVLFAMPIEPEKEMVLVLTKKDITEAVAKAIREALHIDDPGNGVLFIVGVNEAHGLY